MARLKKWVSVCFFTMVCATTCGASDSEDRMNNFLTENGKLKETLVLKDGQEGFVGIKGNIWTIEPSGLWHISHFLNEQIDKPYRKGYFTAKELATVADVLVSNKFSKLPAYFGRDLKINRHLLVIRFGKKSSTLVLNTGEPLTTKDVPMPQTHIWERFIVIVQTIQNLLKDNS